MIVSICLSIQLAGLLFITRSNWVFNRRYALAEAIHDYNIDLMLSGQTTDSDMYDRMFSYNRALFRFWDWNAAHLMPKEDYEKIKQYIIK